MFASAGGCLTAPTARPALGGGRRFLTINFIIRVNQIEATPNFDLGCDETDRNTPENMRLLSDTVRAADPTARVTWAFSWKALHDSRPQFSEMRRLAVDYHRRFGDDVTFFPGGYFAPMYAPRAQVNRDLHAALEIIRKLVGGGFNPKSVVAGYLSADNLRYLAEHEGIHTAQATIWSQYGIDNGDGDGSICYPYYPSREHVCKPAQGPSDFIDCVTLDGWTVDFLCARRFGYGDGFNSRLGVGPIEAYAQGHRSPEGRREVWSVTRDHFSDACVRRNGFGWLTVCWEVALAGDKYGRDMTEGLDWWIQEIKKTWPDARILTQGEFGDGWRAAYPDNSRLDYGFTRRGSGIGGSEPELELTWEMNRDFRLATLRNWQKNEEPKIIDFTRYDLPAQEPPDPVDPRHPVRNWSLINRINQKGVRPQDRPTPFSDLSPDDRAFIRRRLGGLFDRNEAR